MVTHNGLPADSRGRDEITTLTHSYAHGIGEKPLTGRTVAGTLAAAAARWPDRDALVATHQRVRLSWRQLDGRVTDLAAGFVAAGLAPGERLGILAPNLAEWVVVQFAAARAGLILVNINPAYRLDELEYALNKTGCRALVTSASFKSSDYIAMLRELAPEIDACPRGALRTTVLPELRLVYVIGDQAVGAIAPLSDVVADEDSHARVRALEPLIDFDDPVNIQFTSGTTGAPKAATLSHHNMVNNAALSAHIMRLGEHDRLCIPVPMYHCFGMVLGTLLCATCGAAMVLPSPGFDADAMLDAIEKERCTAVHGVPTMFIAALETPGFPRRDLSSLRTGIMAGAPCPEELMRRVINDMHLSEITIAYGMTETGPLSTQTMVDDPLELRVGTVGRVLPHTEVKIVDPDGHIVAPDSPGELCTRGYSVMHGYWGDDERTAADIDASHWMRSGDIATIDVNGYVRIVGRIKDMLIRGGENIYPREIEEFLYNHPDIEEVEVFGVPDPHYGEEVAAWIRPKPGREPDAEEIRAFCRGRLAHFKIPRYIRFVEEFPMTATGKVQKFAMREQMAKELETGCRSGS